MSLTSVSTITVVQDDDDGSIVLFQGRAEQHKFSGIEICSQQTPEYARYACRSTLLCFKKPVTF